MRSTKSLGQLSRAMDCHLLRRTAFTDSSITAPERYTAKNGIQFYAGMSYFTQPMGIGTNETVIYFLPPHRRLRLLRATDRGVVECDGHSHVSHGVPPDRGRTERRSCWLHRTTACDG